MNLRDLLENSIRSVELKNNESLELEARFGSLEKFVNSGFMEINDKIFNRILLFFRSQNLEEQLIETTDYYYEEKRVTNGYTIIKRGIKIGNSYSVTDQNFNYKIVLNVEKQQLFENRSQLKPSNIRNKIRHRFVKENCYIDMTIVNDKYEIEIEYILNKSISEFINEISSMVKLIQNSHLAYSYNNWRFLITKYNEFLGSKNKENKLDHKFLVNARNLHRKDCVWGGLIGGNISYAIAKKAEGFRKQLVLLENGIWLVSPPNDICLLFNYSDPNLINTIIDGENIDPDRRIGDAPNSKFYFLFFDIMCFNSDKNIQNEDYSYRLNLCKSISEVFVNNDILYVELKKVIFLGASMNSLICAFNTISHEDCNYKTDGYIITPINCKYNPESDKLPMYKRILTKNPDICKLKPWDQLTIDLYLEDLKFYVGKFDKGKIKNVEFTGGYEPVFYNLDSFNNLNNCIVECGPIKIEDKIYLTLVRVREDKKHPNKEDVAIDVWNDINNPLDFNIFKGETFSLVRQYHNKIKRQLFENGNLDTDLIDIGYGYGGDMAKQKNYHKILGIEPNFENYTECLNRYKKMDFMKDKLKLINTGGEDKDKIIKSAKKHFNWKKGVTKKLHISMMLSMSFFWNNEESINNLNRTLIKISEEYKKYGGYEEITFIFMTIDGEKTLELFNNKGNKFNLGIIEMNFRPPNRVYINIEGTIVKNQNEYLVYINQLNCLSNIEYKIANEERFLSDDDKQFTNLYIYGTAKINFTNTLKEMSEDILKGEIGRQDFPTEVFIFNNISYFDDLRFPVSFNEWPDFFVENYFDVNFFRVSVIRTLSFYHSILKCVDDDYNVSNPLERIKKASNLKNHFLSFNNLEDTNYIYREMVELLCNNLQLNIFILTLNNGKLNPFQYFKAEKENRPTIALIMYEDNTFEPIGYVKKNNELFLIFK